MLKYCGCIDTSEMDGPRCQILNKTQDMCKQIMYYFHQEDLLPCVCPQSCREIYYEERMSMSLWPSNIYLKNLLRTIHSLNNKTLNINDKYSTRENLVSLAVYFEELNYDRMEELPSYELFQLVSDIGGALGLFIGLSLLTVFEFFEFLYTLIKTLRNS
ncbi:acid-sensing ion channel 2-like [Ptychodera flava]|uniref:acid-sensing ion channel 2-like n=1 Tax=Ptychodera flava TaxID=63121 RepID=UPI003969F021